MAANRRYDDKTRTLWVFRSYDEPETLVPNDEIKGWIEVLKSGETDGGEAIDSINYVFASDKTAEYNHHALGFARIGTFTGSLNDPKSFGEAAEFGVRSDFGIDD
jgi:hypothetical protein